MKTYRIFDCTTIDQTRDRFVFGYRWMADLFCTVLTMITDRPHDFNEVDQETTESISL